MEWYGIHGSPVEVCTHSDDTPIRNPVVVEVEVEVEVAPGYI